MSRIKSGNGLDGTSNAFAKPGEGVLIVHHDPNIARAQDRLHGDKSIARDGAPKRFHPVSVHNGMTAQQQKMTGMGHPVAGSPDASSANPLDPTTPGKRLTPVTKSPGMRSRTNAAHSAMDLHELGRCILDEAVWNK